MVRRSYHARNASAWLHEPSTQEIASAERIRRDYLLQLIFTIPARVNGGFLPDRKVGGQAGMN